MDKFGGVVILSGSGSARPDVSPRATKGCAVTPKRAARCVWFVREGRWNLLSCFTEKNLPLLLGTHSLTTGFRPLQMSPVNLKPLGFHPDHPPDPAFAHDTKGLLSAASVDSSLFPETLSSLGFCGTTFSTYHSGSSSQPSLTASLPSYLTS